MFLPTHTPEQRLAVFRDLRQRPDHTPGTIAQAFSDIKITPRYLDFYTPDSWPSVFDIVREGYFCQTGVTLMIAGALWYLKLLNNTEVTMDAISNTVNGNDGIILIDGDRCYNFIPGEIVTPEYVKENSITLDSHKIAPDKFFR